MNAVLFDVALTAYIVAMVAASASSSGGARGSWVALLLTQAGWVFHTRAHRPGRRAGPPAVLTLAELVSVVIWVAVLFELWAERRYRVRVSAPSCCR